MLVGTCSWTDPRLLATGWYPRGSRDAAGRLRHYASRFGVVEVDASYYALPSERNSRLWVERTPAGFVFDIKAFALLTGHPTPVSALPARLRPTGAGRRVYARQLPGAVLDEAWALFRSALEPLHQAGRLGAVNLQFPPWFRPGAGPRAELARCARRCAPYQASVEFRDGRWLAPEERDSTLALLAEHGLALCGVDMDQGHPGAVPPVAEVTSQRLAVVRLHGRSPRWAAGDRVERYLHRYTEAELREWVPRVRRLAAGAEQVHVLFNNCCGDSAVRGAAAMARLLAETGVGGCPQVGAKPGGGA